MKRLFTYRLGAVALAGALVALGACADGPTPPTNAYRGAPTLATTTTTTKVGDTTFTTFEYDYRLGTTVEFDKHKVVMPALSVCDPAKTKYGVDEWDKSCTPAKHNITITAKHWLDASGHPQVDFDQHLRFVPTTDDNKFVKLFIRDKDASDAQLAAYLRIDWVPYLGATPIDEYATDPTLRTQVNEKAGVVWRRIKHFSGYMVASGRME